MKISTDSIQGFAEMSDADKVTALLGLEVPDPVDLSGYVKKEVFDAKASEAAKYSQQLKDKMTDDEKATKEAAEAHQKLQDDYNELLKKSTIAEHTARFLALGYDEKLARATAEALFDGDMNKVFENQQTFNAVREKALRAEIMKDTPRPEGAGGVEQKSENVDLATKLGKAKADALKSSEDIMKFYT